MNSFVATVPTLAAFKKAEAKETIGLSALPMFWTPPAVFLPKPTEGKL